MSPDFVSEIQSPYLSSVIINAPLVSSSSSVTSPRARTGPGRFRHKAIQLSLGKKFLWVSSSLVTYPPLLVSIMFSPENMIETAIICLT